jgi:predicted nucleotidyltransferase
MDRSGTQEIDDIGRARAAVTQSLAQDPDVLASWIFGSRARGDARPDSDLDVAILPARPPRSGETPLQRQLRWMDAIGQRLGAGPRVDVTELSLAGPIVAHRVLREGQLLVDRDPARRSRWVEECIHCYMEAQEIREASMDARARRLGRGGP